eukprot:scaffold103154_cov62-Attheya_sp.AAC.1
MKHPPLSPPPGLPFWASQAWAAPFVPSDPSGTSYHDVLAHHSLIAHNLNHATRFRYVIYPIQVLAKSCKPVPVMLMGALMGKKYPLKKYMNVVLIVFGVALFMGGGGKSGKKSGDASSLEEESSPSQMFGIFLLFISLCFDGGTGAYEDKLMAVHVFMQMCQDMGFLLVALGLSGAMGQVFIFVTISKFGALTCSIIGLARKVTTLVASIYFYGHHLGGVQLTGLF